MGATQTNFFLPHLVESLGKLGKIQPRNKINEMVEDLKDQWIGLREHLQETIDFPINYGAFLQIFP